MIAVLGLWLVASDTLPIVGALEKQVSSNKVVVGILLPHLNFASSADMDSPSVVPSPLPPTRAPLPPPPPRGAHSPPPSRATRRYLPRFPRRSPLANTRSNALPPDPHPPVRDPANTILDLAPLATTHAASLVAPLVLGGCLVGPSAASPELDVDGPGTAKGGRHGRRAGDGPFWANPTSTLLGLRSHHLGSPLASLTRANPRVRLRRATIDP